MKTKAGFWVFLILLATFYGCSNSNQKEKNNDRLMPALKEKALEEGQNITKATLSAFQKHLKQAMKAGGPDNALEYCHKKAMFLTDSMSQVYSVKIRRLAKKNRNPFNFLDEQSMQVFNEYEKQLAKGEKLQPRILTDKKGNPVYYAPIRLGKDVCLKCHGTPGKEIPESRMALLKKYYPEDKAVNFKKGDLRGIWVVNFDRKTLKN